MPPSKPPTRRQERINARIVEETVEGLRAIKDSRLGFVTVIGAEVSPDLRHATVRFSVFTDDPAVKDVTLGLVRHQARAIRSRLAKGLGGRVVPMLHFELDDSVREADEMSRLIKDARATDPNPGEPTPDQAAMLATAAGVGDRDADTGALPPKVERWLESAAAGAAVAAGIAAASEPDDAWGPPDPDPLGEAAADDDDLDDAGDWPVPEN